MRFCGCPSMRCLQVRPACRTGERGRSRRGRRGGHSAGQRRARRSRCNLVGCCAASWASVLLVAGGRQRRRCKRPRVWRSAARLRGVLRQWLFSRGSRGRTHEQRGRQQDAGAAPPHGSRALRTCNARHANFSPFGLAQRSCCVPIIEPPAVWYVPMVLAGHAGRGATSCVLGSPSPAAPACNISCRARHTRATRADGSKSPVCPFSTGWLITGCAHLPSGSFTIACWAQTLDWLNSTRSCGLPAQSAGAAELLFAYAAIPRGFPGDVCSWCPRRYPVTHRFRYWCVIEAARKWQSLVLCLATRTGDAAIDREQV